MGFLKSSPYWFTFGEIIEKEMLFVKIRLLNDEVFLFECSEDISKQLNKLKKGDSIGFWFEDSRNGKMEIKVVELNI